MIKELYTNGCSWTAGSELEQDPAFKDFLNTNGWRMQGPDDELNWNIVDKDNQIVSRVESEYDKFNWPGHLKKLTGATTLINQAKGGSSNNRILRTTLDYIRNLKPEDYKTTLIVIGWTISERNEIYINKEWHYWNLNRRFSQTADKSQYSDAYIAQIDKFHQDYIELIYNDYVGIKTYFDTVYLLSNTLDNLGIKYYFFNGLPAWSEGDEYKIDFDVEQLFAKELEWHENHTNIQRYRNSFMHFMHRENFAWAKYKHPLHDAHVNWASYLHRTLIARRILDKEHKLYV